MKNKYITQKKSYLFLAIIFFFFVNAVNVFSISLKQTNEKKTCYKIPKYISEYRNYSTQSIYIAFVLQFPKETNEFSEFIYPIVSNNYTFLNNQIQDFRFGNAEIKEIFYYFASMGEFSFDYSCLNKSDLDLLQRKIWLKHDSISYGELLNEILSPMGLSFSEELQSSNKCNVVKIQKINNQRNIEKPILKAKIIKIPYDDEYYLWYRKIKVQ